jgi:predicted transcriptional regulator
MKRTTIRVSSDLHNELSRIAAKNMRSLNSEINKALTEYTEKEILIGLNEL